MKSKGSALGIETVTPQPDQGVTQKESCDSGDMNGGLRTVRSEEYEWIARPSGGMP
jgi:hypothetical protein